METQQKRWHLKYFPARDAVLHAKWKNKGITSMIITHSLSVSIKTRAAPRSWQVTNDVFKQGTKNRKYKQGDRCVFWRTQSRTHRSVKSAHQAAKGKNGVVGHGHHTQVPLSGSVCPSPWLLGASLLQKVHRCVPQRELPSATGNCPAQENTPHPSPPHHGIAC